MFVLGDHEVIKRSKQLILNLFGYAEEDRNILNPFMDETIKELALIDGAFIVQVMAYRISRMLNSGKRKISTRWHGYETCRGRITQTTDSLALVVSSSVKSPISEKVAVYPV